jgi:hypothetical protein
MSETAQQIKQQLESESKRLVDGFDLVTSHIEAMRKKERRLAQTEMAIWVGVGALLSLYFFYERDIPLYGYWLDISLIGLGLFPLFAAIGIPALFQQVFGALPLSLFRLRAIRYRQQLETVDQFLRHESYAAGKVQEQSASIRPPFSSSLELLLGDLARHSRDHGLKLLSALTTRSADTAASIYSRAGVYLVVGVLVAMLGLAYFYIATSQVVLEKVETVTMATISSLPYAGLLQMIPNFGILFFIEFIAFFFLRQYRAAMDEFRYFEAIQRHREELLALAFLSDRADSKLDLKELLKMGVFYSGRQILGRKETTEIIEARKLEKNEVEVLEKIIDKLGK